MTECTQSSFEFQAHFSREVVARFDGGTMTSDAGGLLLRETDRRLNLLPRLAQCFLDGRDPARVQHSVEEMVAQRVYGLALGYEDLNDHEQLRQDPLLKLLAGQPDLEAPLAGKSTLNRLELSTGTPDRYKKITFWKSRRSTSCWWTCFWKRTATGAAGADRAGPGHHRRGVARRSGRPLLPRLLRPLLLSAAVHVLREHLLCARLRPANIDAAAGSLTEIQRIVEQIRAAVARSAHHPARRLRVSAATS